MWDGDQMGEPESGSAWVFRWNNIEKATSPSESEQHSRGGAVGVSACCLLSVPTPTARRLPGHISGSHDDDCDPSVIFKLACIIICSCLLILIFCLSARVSCLRRGSCACSDIALMD